MGIETSKPLVSVITPFFNAEKFIQEAVASLFAQTYDNWELLLVDDGSTDGSTDIVLRYVQQYPERVRYLEHVGHVNRGPSASRSLGVSQAKGEYIAFLDADDVYLPHTLERQLAILDSQPEAAMVCGHAEWWRSWTGNPDARRDHVRPLGVQLNRVIQPPILLRALLRGKGVPSMCTVMVRCEALARMGGYPADLRNAYEDEVFLAKMFLNMPVFVSEECWTKYRQHPDSLCAVAERAGKTDSARVVFLNWLGKYLSKQRSRNAEVWQAFEMANWAAYSHPISYRLYPILYRLLGRSWYVVRRATQRMHASTQRTRDPTSKNASVYEGCHDRTSCRKIRGWVRDLNQPDRPIKLDIYADDILLATVTADEFRQDLTVTGKGNGCHAFWYFVPPWLKDGRTHSIRVKVAGTNIDLRNTPRFINCELQIIKDIRFIGARLRIERRFSKARVWASVGSCVDE